MSELSETSGTSETQMLERNDAIRINPPSSSKVLGVFSGMLLNINLMIGSGIYATPGTIMGLTRSGGITLLGSTIAESGGEQIYFEKAFPNPKKMVAYIFSFSSVVLVKPINIISISTAGSRYIYYAIHNGYNRSTIEDIYNIEFCNKIAVWINQILAVIKVLTLLTVVIIGFTKINKKRLSFNYLFGNARGIEYYNNYVSSMLKVLFAYSGWNILYYSLDEMRNPGRKLRISNPASVLIVGILYCLTIFALIVTVPTNFTDYFDDPVTMSAKLGDEIGSGIAISILVAISCFGAVGSGIWGSSRLIASVAKAGFIPVFSPVLRKFDEKWNTPFNALVFQWCYLTMILCIPFKNPYDVLVNTAQNTNIIFYFMCAIGLLVLRKTEPERSRPFRIDLLWVYFFILFSLAIFVGTFFPAPNTESQDFIEKYYYIITYTVIIFGLICWYLIYYLPRRNSNPTPPEMSNVVTG
ncbi:hypothetical protein Glove_144g96 [Diversispora epigaea]|uniref:Amino acid permease/ SLC12A domain-containing protein n=1 Tax=Diversispora epigaea TaxID=1348612 RepID=A0A397IWW6_9GLOM|nr:hypothetical protein Glove_144g96 [Diversispora epigaea]